MVETNTFNATSIAMADYNLEEIVPELNRAAAKFAREAADEAMAKDPSRPRFVAGAIGPTNRTAFSPDANDPSLRNVRTSMNSWMPTLPRPRLLSRAGRSASSRNNFRHSHSKRRFSQLRIT